MSRRKLWRWILLLFAIEAWILAIYLLTEGALHIPASMRQKPSGALANALAAPTQSNWRDVSIHATDGTILSAWLFTPPNANGRAAILMHGISDTRSGSSALTPALLKEGYTVLMPDSRGHGTSGGTVISYGVQEVDDTKRWVDWLYSNAAVQQVYGWGVSYGAAVLLETTAAEPRLRTVVADSVFSSFSTVARDRISGSLVTSAFVPPVVTALMIKPALLYTEWRYKVDLATADPSASLLRSRRPVLLIHGLDDRETLPRHSEVLHKLDPEHFVLWEVPHAGHAGSYGAQPAEYQRRVLAWFAAH